MTPDPYIRVTVEVDSRSISYFKHDPKDPDKITGRGKKWFHDLHVTSITEKGRKHTDVFTVHEYRKEKRIRLPKTSRKDKDLSMTVDDFTAYVKRRWLNLAHIVLLEVHAN